MHANANESIRLDCKIVEKKAPFVSHVSHLQQINVFLTFILCQHGISKRHKMNIFLLACLVSTLRPK